MKNSEGNMNCAKVSQLCVLCSLSVLVFSCCSQKNHPDLIFEKVECPSGTQMIGNPPVSERVLQEREKTEPPVDCSREVLSMAVISCQAAMAKAGYKQHCERKDGTKHGPWIGWDRKGTKRMSGEFVEGKPHGIQLQWDHQSRVVNIVQFESGIKNGNSWEFGDSIVNRILWQDGREVDSQVWYLNIPNATATTDETKRVYIPAVKVAEPTIDAGQADSGAP